MEDQRPQKGGECKPYECGACLSFPTASGSISLNLSFYLAQIVAAVFIWAHSKRVVVVVHVANEIIAIADFNRHCVRLEVYISIAKCNFLSKDFTYNTTSSEEKRGNSVGNEDDDTLEGVHEERSNADQGENKTANSTEGAIVCQ